MKTKTLIAVLALVLAPFSLLAQPSSSTADSLKVIGDFADRLCQTVPINVSSDKVELTGTAKAELEGVVKKLANLGVSGAAKYDSASSQNVLQTDLAKVLNESRSCRLQVWNDLKGKFEIGTPTATSKNCATFPGTDVCMCIANENSGWRGPGQPTCATEKTSGTCRCPTPQGWFDGTVKMQ